MAITQTLVRRTVFGDRKVRVYDITFDNVYAAGGWAVSTTDFPAGQIDTVLVGQVGGLQLSYDYSANKLKANYSITAGTTAGAEIGNGANALNGLTVRVEMIGY